MDPNEADVPDAIEVECAINLLTDALCVAPVGTDVDALTVAVQQAAAQIRARQSRITELTRQRGVAEARVANLAEIITCAASDVRGAPVDGAEWAGREGELLDAALPRLVGAVRERDDAAKAAAVEYEQASARWHEDMCRVTRERDHTGKMVEVWRERCKRAREFQVLLHGIIVGMAAAVGEDVPQIPHMARIRLTSLDTPEVPDTTCKGSDDG